MEGKNVVFFEVDRAEENYLRDKLEHHAQLTFYPFPLEPHTVDHAKDADIIGSFIYSTFSQTILDQLPRLKGIVTMSVGCDHIDVAEAERRRIKICNVPNYGPNTVAEHTMALLLALSRRIVPSVERTRLGDYDYQGLSGWDLMGKTIGIVGTGKIGALVAQAAKGLQMKVIGYDPHPNQTLADKLDMKYMSLAEILQLADVISLHVPLTNETKHMLSKEEFSQMKRGVVIINTARGGLIDLDALISALDQGIVSQAGLDVLEDEGVLREEKEFFSPNFKLKDYQTALANHRLMRDERVLVTPHNAFNSKESLAHILQTTVEDVIGLLTGDVVNTINK